ncbi:MAG TPA: hypothetical protein VNA25_08125 [Phycisphaerae bacterium]|nr:hypothetical protein [Phycisphaerae bacterium]
MRTVDTYERFHRHIAAWVDHEIDSLVVTGKPGTGKSHAYKDAMGLRPYHLLGGRQTPIQAYITVHDDPDFPVVCDDISALLRDHNFIAMFKALCETGRKIIHWGTTTSKLEGRPRSFICTSPVLIVLNKIPKKDEDVMAVLDRCDGIIFEPTKQEIITRMRTIFAHDHALIDLLAKLPVIPTLRTLIKARQWERSRHLNLAEELFSECGVPQPVATLVNIMETLPEEAWCSTYLAATKLTDRTYRRHKSLAEQIVSCRKSRKSCPNVRAAKDMGSMGGDRASLPGREVRLGQTDIGSQMLVWGQTEEWLNDRRR